MPTMDSNQRNDLDAAVLNWLYDDTTATPRGLAANQWGRRQPGPLPGFPDLSKHQALESLRRLRDRGLARHAHHGREQWWELTSQGEQHYERGV